MSDIEHLSNYPLPQCPKNDNCKSDKSQQSMGPPSLRTEYKFMSVANCYQLQLTAELLPTASNCSRLLSTAADCSRLQPTAPDCCRLLQTVPDCSRLQPTAANCCQLLPTAADCWIS